MSPVSLVFTTSLPASMPFSPSLPFPFSLATLFRAASSAVANSLYPFDSAHGRGIRPAAQWSLGVNLEAQGLAERRSFSLFDALNLLLASLLRLIPGGRILGLVVPGQVLSLLPSPNSYIKQGYWSAFLCH